MYYVTYYRNIISVTHLVRTSTEILTYLLKDSTLKNIRRKLLLGLYRVTQLTTYANGIKCPPRWSSSGKQHQTGPSSPPWTRASISILDLSFSYSVCSCR